MGRSATSQESAHVFLERLQLEAKFLSYEQIESINNALAKATVVLHQAHNDRSPLFKLPIEILHSILELVPDLCTRRWKHYHPFWHNNFTDSSTLMPVIHTCHRLREVALAHPIIWTTFQFSFKKLALVRQLATWSAHVPLNAIGCDAGVLNELPANTRFRSIHLYDSGKGRSKLRAVVEQFSSATLSSFSLLCNNKYHWDPKESAQPLSLAHAPNLRHLALDEAGVLPDKGFLRLTHLALLRLDTPELHTRLIGFLRGCPLLESVALSDFTLDEDVPNDLVPIPLHRLRHVTFIDFFPDALRYYLALLQPRVHGSSVQVLGYHARDPSFPRRFLLPSSSHPQEGRQFQSQAKVCIGVHPSGQDDHSVSLTTVSAHTTRRIASWVPQLGVNGIAASQWPSVVFSDPPTPPWTIDEVWLYGIGMLSSAWKRSPLRLFPHARTVVLVAEGGTHHDGPSSLRLLPSVHDPKKESDAGEPVSITTLRLVHGFKEYDGFCEFAASHGADGHPCQGEMHRDRLRFSHLIRDFRSGGYGYIKHFVLQVTPHIDVDEGELDVLRNLENFETFRFERIEKFPDMPGHSDPAYRGGGRYPGALW